jgi:hypothetical protein
MLVIWVLPVLLWHVAAAAWLLYCYRAAAVAEHLSMLPIAPDVGQPAGQATMRKHTGTLNRKNDAGAETPRATADALRADIGAHFSRPRVLLAWRSVSKRVVGGCARSPPGRPGLLLTGRGRGRSWPPKHILQDISGCLCAGHLHALVGPSGGCVCVLVR